MDHINVSDQLIKQIHQMVFDELKTKRKINKFVRECKELNKIVSYKELNGKINELIEDYYMLKDIKFNRNLDDFFLSDVEYIIFYYFRENDYQYDLL
jgi:predicted Holliday junction resolvase-like endonuclease